MTAVNIPKLRVRPKKAQNLSQCAVEMSALATCWASASIDDKRCAETAKALTACMQKGRPAPAKRTNINHHLARLGKQVLGK
ncbi:hypothetical protein GGI15_003298 [Coemansia interrupta]|uniref:37S ribosomal protein mrp10, mitochondrial n=1 Tax=Coemansia interrupta TaxID=1126814 RepID=A0A9W8LIA9_9FUNG|nr:hypothetical protein GGI15_003298 [Coemansia interrupta]